MTITVDSFKKKYVTSVEFNEGDFIVVTKDNIDRLRQELRKTDMLILMIYMKQNLNINISLSQLFIMSL